MDDRLFTNKDLRAMIIPLFVEQFLLLLAQTYRHLTEFVP